MNKHYKQLVSLLLAIILTSSFTGFAFATDTTSSNTDKDLTFINVDYTKSDNIRVDLNNAMLTFITNPQIINGTTLVPFRAIFESLGLTVNYDSTTQTVSGKNDKYDISLVLGSTTATVNKENKTLSVAPKIINNSTMIPLRFISETLGYHIVWVGNSNLILISEKNIIEWRYGGHEKDTAKNYEIEYINGVATTTTRYTGTLWTPSIQLNSTSGIINIGNSYQIGIVLNTASDQTVGYSSSDSSIATVNSNGTVLAIGLGTVTITVTNMNYDSVTCTIIVANKISNPTTCYFTKDSWGGIRMYWGANNYSGKNIKYCVLNIYMYNQVGDIIASGYSGSTKFVEHIIGLIAPNQMISSNFIIGYSQVCNKVVVNGIHLDYMDGTSEDINYYCEGFQK